MDAGGRDLGHHAAALARVASEEVVEISSPRLGVKKVAIEVVGYGGCGGTTKEISCAP